MSEWRKECDGVMSIREGCVLGVGRSGLSLRKFSFRDQEFVKTFNGELILNLEIVDPLELYFPGLELSV